MEMKKMAKIVAVLAGVGGAHYLMPPEIQDLTPTSDIAETPALPVPAPSPDSFPEIKISKIMGATTQEQEMVKKGFQYANDVLASVCLWKKIASAKITETGGLTNEQIYLRLANHPVTAGVKIFTGSWWQNHVTKTMGYDIGDGIVYVNRYFVHTPLTLGSLAIHEAEGHGQGFHHYGVKSTSVPYQLNRIYAECSEELGIK